MITNHTNYTTPLSDGNVTETCVFDPLGASLQFAVIAVNFPHLFILHQLNKRERTAVLNILFIMSVNDLCVAGFNAARLCCVHRSLMSDACIMAVIVECTFNILLARYYILALACYDRFVAICQPFRYTTHRLLQNVSITIVVIFMSTLLVGLPLKLSSQRCWIFFSVISELVSDILVKIITIIRVLIMTLAAGVTALSSAFVLKELHMMSKRRGNTRTPDSAVLKATYAVLMTLLVFIICLIPAAVAFFTARTTISAEVRGVILRLSFDGYAILNVIVYGAMSKNYREKVAQIGEIVAHRCKRRNEVQPSSV